MPIPAFDRFGLLPDGIHECTIKEVEVDLAWTDERRRLTAQLREFISVELTPRFTLMPPLVLDGSYVSRKANPSNINLVMDQRFPIQISGRGSAFQRRDESLVAIGSNEPSQRSPEGLR